MAKGLVSLISSCILGASLVLPLYSKAVMPVSKEKAEEGVDEPSIIKIRKYIEIPKRFYKQTEQGIEFRTNLEILNGKINNQEYKGKNFSNLIKIGDNVPDIAVFNVGDEMVVLVDEDFVNKYDDLFVGWNPESENGGCPECKSNEKIKKAGEGIIPKIRCKRCKNEYWLGLSNTEPNSLPEIKDKCVICGKGIVEVVLKYKVEAFKCETCDADFDVSNFPMNTIFFGNGSDPIEVYPDFGIPVRYRINLPNKGIYFSKGQKLEYHKTDIKRVYADVIKFKRWGMEALPHILALPRIIIHSGEDLEKEVLIPINY